MASSRSHRGHGIQQTGRWSNAAADVGFASSISMRPSAALGRLQSVAIGCFREAQLQGPLFCDEPGKAAGMSRPRPAPRTRRVDGGSTEVRRLLVASLAAVAGRALQRQGQAAEQATPGKGYAAIDEAPGQYVRQR
jgi:hypothetical protein